MPEVDFALLFEFTQTKIHQIQLYKCMPMYVRIKNDDKTIKWLLKLHIASLTPKYRNFIIK